MKEKDELARVSNALANRAKLIKGESGINGDVSSGGADTCGGGSNVEWRSGAAGMPGECHVARYVAVGKCHVADT